MSLRETGHSSPETAVVRMRTGLIELANEFHQIDGMLERVPRFIVGNSSRPISAEREDVSNGRLGVSKENGFDLLFVVTDAGKVRNRVELCCVLNALDETVRQITCRAAGTVRYADKMRHVRFEVANRLIESLGRLCG